MTFSFRTIQSATTGLYKEKGSKFIALAFPVDSEDDIQERLRAIRKEYLDARHHCDAYLLGADGKKFRAFDDGEPNHSAGDPILGQIRSKEITNVLVVVVRYFGGVKLGVGGLVSAYKAATADALGKAVVIEKDLTRELTFEFEYQLTPEVMHLVKEWDLKILEQSFEGICAMTISYKMKSEELLLDKMSALERKGLRKIDPTR